MNYGGSLLSSKYFGSLYSAPPVFEFIELIEVDAFFTGTIDNTEIRNYLTQGQSFSVNVIFDIPPKGEAEFIIYNSSGSFTFPVVRNNVVIPTDIIVSGFNYFEFKDTITKTKTQKFTFNVSN